MMGNVHLLLLYLGDIFNLVRTVIVQLATALEFCCKKPAILYINNILFYPHQEVTALPMYMAINCLNVLSPKLSYTGQILPLLAVILERIPQQQTVELLVPHFTTFAMI